MIVPPKLIIVPLDFSDPSHAALDVATEFAARLGSELCLVHIVSTLPKLPASVSNIDEGEYEQVLHSDAQQRLNGIVEKLAQRKVHATAAVSVANDVPAEIARI